VRWLWTSLSSGLWRRVFWLEICLRNICNVLPNSTASRVILMSPIHTSCDKCFAVYRRTVSPWLICAFNHCHTRAVPTSLLRCGASYMCLVTNQRQSERCKGANRGRTQSKTRRPVCVSFFIHDLIKCFMFLIMADCCNRDVYVRFTGRPYRQQQLIQPNSVRWLLM
jgi:hypothetical protein